jgi:allophanate hydrolase
MLPEVLTLAALQALYQKGEATPAVVVQALLTRIEASADKAVWISRRSREDLLSEARALMAQGPTPDKPLWGVPFAVKDNIDVAGLPVTGACPAFAFEPQADAFAVARLRAAGAILIGKTNLDQFATGLNGTRSPYGAPRCVFDADYVSGGSSSGSAVAVASGQVAFALGTDTAGSGRIPAAFNNLVGVKPTRGLVSNSGLTPACRSLDCITVLAGCVGDADRVRRIMQGFDAADPYSRPMQARSLPDQGLRCGVLGSAEREFFGDEATAALYDAAIERMAALGAVIVEIDYAPFRECAALLYGGPWVAERLAAIEDFALAHGADMDPTVREIVLGARDMSAVDAFRGAYGLEGYRRRADAEWAKMDVLLLPTAPTIYKVADMLADPVRLNSNLGRYTNFVNLLDCAAIAIPAGFRPDGLPGGVTLVGPAFCDDALAALGQRLHQVGYFGMGCDRDAPAPAQDQVDGHGPLILVAAVGAHLTGMPLNRDLVAGNGVLLRTCRTARDYRLFALPNSVPPKPGLRREPGFEGEGIEVEVWGLKPAAFGVFTQSVPEPLGIGNVTLEDGSIVKGFICEPYGLAGAQEITRFGGWRPYVASKKGG